MKPKRIGMENRAFDNQVLLNQMAIMQALNMLVKMWSSGVVPDQMREILKNNIRSSDDILVMIRKHHGVTL